MSSAPLNSHWYDSGSEPVAVTLKLVVKPAFNTWSCGCEIIAGGIDLHLPLCLKCHNREISTGVRTRLKNVNSSTSPTKNCPATSASPKPPMKKDRFDCTGLAPTIT